MKERLKIIIKSLGINQKKLAESVGLQPSTISDFMNGRFKSLSSDTIEKLYRVYGVNPLWLLTGEGEMFLFNSSDICCPPGPDGKRIIIPSELQGDRLTPQEDVHCVNEKSLDYNVISGGADIFDGEINHVRWFFSLPREKQTAILAIAELENPVVVNRIKEVLLFEVEDQRRKKRAVPKPNIKQKGEAG